MKDPREVRELIESKVPLSLLLDRTGHGLSQYIKPEQMSCPFHGADLSKSARYYPETGTMYCWTCKKVWSSISYWMEYQEVRYMTAARQLADMYKIDLSQIADIKNARLALYNNKGKKEVDKIKMALYLLEERMKLAKIVEPPEVFAKMLYVFLSSKRIENPDEFAKLTIPLAKRLKASLG